MVKNLPASASGCSSEVELILHMYKALGSSPSSSICVFRASLVAAAGKESACNAGDPGSIPGSGSSPGERIGYLLQYSCLENLNGQRSLVCYSPCGHKELDMTEQLRTVQHSLIQIH